LYAVAGSAADLMEGWFDQNDPELMAVLEELADIEQQRKSAEIQTFTQEMSDARVVVLEGADHWIFLSHEQDVLRLMREFVEGL
jgi:pimeloyl-ACP methyl ester carboxylesterase